MQEICILRVHARSLLRITCHLSYRYLELTREKQVEVVQKLHSMGVHIESVDELTQEIEALARMH